MVENSATLLPAVLAAARLSVHTTMPVSARTAAISPEPNPATTKPSA